jgi:hypothetical protein
MPWLLAMIVLRVQAEIPISTSVRIWSSQLCIWSRALQAFRAKSRRRFVKGNTELALAEEAHPGAARKRTGWEKALLVGYGLFKPADGPRAMDAGFVGKHDREAHRAYSGVARDVAPPLGLEGVEPPHLILVLLNIG